ncbi:MAG: Ribosomal protein L13 [Candidatus Methanohalarchaeum thermophilum]|uniref:50S ribosomal protein L13 n=1 Tax=Methanohalarchaeum thermophilum TaxID=1903181 RepID=A0A1Q6DRW1_METT1|nr:MAG: Ribosomal protein L13 [Candidatus Methanohalarchaeum thermophilum]
MIIDAKGSILGRLATHIAEKALEGEKIVILNAEKAIITGNREHIFDKYKQRYDRGSKDWGPHYPRVPDRIVKRAIRNMVPHKQEKGEKALDRIEVNMGVPAEYEDEEITEVEDAAAGDISKSRYVEIEEISKSLGWTKGAN